MPAPNPTTRRRLAALGWAIALAVLVAVGWLFPDTGASPNSILQAAPLAIVFAAVPTGVWVWATNDVYLVVTGGGWLVAGAITLVGGNTLMLAAIAYGLAVLLNGAATEPKLTPMLVGAFVGVTAALVGAVILALDPSWTSSLPALLLVVLVVAIGRLLKTSNVDVSSPVPRS